MRKILNKTIDYAGYLGGFCIFLLCALMIFASIGREFGLRVGGVNDVVAWLCAAASFFAMAHAFKHGDFVRVTLLLEKVSDKTRRMMEIVSLSIATISTAYLCFWACRYTYESYKFNDYAGGMVAIPIWIPQFTFVLGSILLVLAVIDELYLVLTHQTPTYERLQKERHAKGDFSSDL